MPGCTGRRYARYNLRRQSALLCGCQYRIGYRNKPEFLKSVQEKGEYLKKEILAIGSPKVKTVRGMGLMLGIVVDKDERAAMVSQLMEKASWS